MMSLSRSMLPFVGILAAFLTLSACGDDEESVAEAGSRPIAQTVADLPKCEESMHGDVYPVALDGISFTCFLGKWVYERRDDKRLEKGSGKMGIAEYLERMFDPFSAEYNGRYPSADTTVVRKRAEVYEGKPQWIYEITDQNYEKPIIKRALPFLSNHLSKEEGVIGTYLKLNKDLLPSIQVRFAEPMTAERLWELMTRPVWSITYAKDDVREVDAKMKFDKPGICYKYE